MNQPQVPPPRLFPPGERVCLSDDPTCSGVNPCDACHGTRTQVLAHALISVGFNDRARMGQFVQNFRVLWQQAAAGIQAEISARRNLAANQPTLNAAMPQAPAHDPRLMAMSPVELRVLRSKYVDNNEGATRAIDAVILHKEQEEQKKAAEAAQAAVKEPTVEDSIFREMTPAEVTALMAQAQQNRLPVEGEVRPEPETVSPSDIVEESQAAGGAAPVEVPDLPGLTSPAGKERAGRFLRPPRKRKPAPEERNGTVPATAAEATVETQEEKANQ